MKKEINEVKSRVSRLVDLENIKNLGDEEEEPDDEQNCVVCLENPKNCAFVPCGHMCVCYGCGQQLKKCPICRIDSTQLIKIFI